MSPRNMLVPLWSRNELAGGARLGGSRSGPYAGQQALWDGRPPRLESGWGPDGFSISCRMEVPQAVPPLPVSELGQSALISVEVGSSWGDKARRQFHVGAGLSADLRLGNFEVVSAKCGPLPAGMTVFFSWTWELVGRGDLLLFQTIPAGTVVQAPEGADSLLAESPCTLTWLVPQLGTTFIQPIAAAVETKAAFPTAFTSNVINKFVWRLRGI